MRNAKLDNQWEYWDRVAWEKEFTNPLDLDLFNRHVPLDAPVLDYGCGYGRILWELRSAGYTNLTGLDTSAEMIKRGRQKYPGLNLIRRSESDPAFSAGSFAAVIMFAVLTCIPSDRGQSELLAEVFRVLRPGGIFYLADFPLQDNEKNLKRYRQFNGLYGPYGTFRLEEGSVMRHHDRSWLKKLTAPFKKLACHEIDITTMNGSDARAFHFLGQKPD